MSLLGCILAFVTILVPNCVAGVVAPASVAKVSSKEVNSFPHMFYSRTNLSRLIDSPLRDYTGSQSV